MAAHGRDARRADRGLSNRTVAFLPPPLRGREKKATGVTSDGRRLAGSILLDDETYSRILASERGDDVGRPVGAATRHDDQLDQIAERGALLEDRLDRVGDVAFLVVGHDPDAAVQPGRAELLMRRLEVIGCAERQSLFPPRLERALHRHGKASPPSCPVVPER